MTIRFAELKDVPPLVELASRMHALTRFRQQPFNAQRAADSFAAIIQQDKGRYVFFVAQNQANEVVGGLIGVMEQQIFTDVFTASIMHIVVLPQARMGGYGIRLLKAFELWAQNRDAFEVYFGVNSGTESDGLGQMVVKMGYVRVGENFVKGY